MKKFRKVTKESGKEVLMYKKVFGKLPKNFYLEADPLEFQDEFFRKCERVFLKKIKLK